MIRLILLCAALLFLGSLSESPLEGQIVKGNRNALYLVRDGKKKVFPDFYTFTQMGFTVDAVKKISDDVLNSIPLGDPVAAIPVFRPDDYMYHKVCDDPDRMVMPIPFVPYFSNFSAHAFCRAR